jgi:hypothetical protein
MPKLEDILTWIGQGFLFYRNFWNWLLPIPEPSISVLLTWASETENNVLNWRKSWKWFGVPAGLYILKYDGVWWPKDFVAFGMAILLLNGCLSRYFPLQEQVCVTRRWFCGVAWVCLAFAGPYLWWGIVSFLLEHFEGLWLPSVPNVVHYHPVESLIAFGAFSGANWMVTRFVPAQITR